MILALLMACGETQPEAIPLSQEYYNWTCKDYQDVSEIIVTSNTCEDEASGLHYLVAEYQLMDRSGFKRKLDKTDNWPIDCTWQTSFPLLEEYCIEVEGVALTAYVEPATYSGILSGD